MIVHRCVCYPSHTAPASSSLCNTRSGLFNSISRCSGRVSFTSFLFSSSSFVWKMSKHTMYCNIHWIYICFLFSFSFVCGNVAFRLCFWWCRCCCCRCFGCCYILLFVKHVHNGFELTFCKSWLLLFLYIFLYTLHIFLSVFFSSAHFIHLLHSLICTSAMIWSALFLWIFFVLLFTQNTRRSFIYSVWFLRKTERISYGTFFLCPGLFWFRGNVIKVEIHWYFRISLHLT